jgi:hypothetical protein
VNIEYAHGKIVAERWDARKTAFTFQRYGAIIRS